LDISPYKLADDAFWATSERGDDSLAKVPVGEFHGLLIDMPARIDVIEHDTLPAGIYHHGTIREMAAVKLSHLGVMTAIDLDTNEIFVGSCAGLEQDDDIIELPPGDPAELPAGDMSSTYSIDLRRLLPLPWRRGSCLVTVLLRDNVSNRAAVEFLDPRISLARAAVRHSHDVGAIVVDGRQQPGSPEVPSMPGIAVAVDRVVDLRDAGSWRLQGAFRLLPLADEVTLALSAASDQPERERPAAIVSVHLVMAGANDGSIDVIRLRVAAASAGAGAVAGYFNVDLLPLTRLRVAQTYFVTAFSGALMSAPLPSALVAPPF